MTTLNLIKEVKNFLEKQAVFFKRRIGSLEANIMEVLVCEGRPHEEKKIPKEAFFGASIQLDRTS